MEAATSCARRFINDRMIVVKLENTAETFHVQKAILCNASNYFIRALDGSFKEGVDHTLSLPGCDKKTFELFLYWTCYRDLPDICKDLKPFTPEREQAQIRLVRLWCFADACLMPTLQNAAMRQLIDCISSSRVSVEALRITFKNTTTDSVLRRAIVTEMSSDYVASFKDPKSQVCYTEEEMDAMGSIPGLMARWTGRLIVTKAECNYGASFQDEDEFMVS